jgi:hypothetical protein
MSHTHRSHPLDAQDTTSNGGIPITTVPCTLLDIAADAPEHHLERALAQAERLQLYDDRAIQADRRRLHRRALHLARPARPPADRRRPP